jgi:hypothetical protein
LVAGLFPGDHTVERDARPHCAGPPFPTHIPGLRRQSVDVEFRLLGNVEIRIDNVLVDIGNTRKCAVLAVLPVEANHEGDPGSVV